MGKDDGCQTDAYYNETGYYPDNVWANSEELEQNDGFFPDADFCDIEPVIGNIPKSSGKKRIALLNDKLLINPKKR